MNHSRVRVELEQEQAWRLTELNFFENQAKAISNADDQRVFRKALVVLLYSHFEGFCTTAFTVYVDELNRAKLTVSDLCWPLAASALSHEFGALRNVDKKSKVFKNKLPDDAKLHRFARERDFLEAMQGVSARQVSLDADQIVDSESNLKPIVLKKLLFRVGLDITLADQWSGTLNKLLNFRNAIAHGARKDGIDAKDYEELRKEVALLIDEITQALHTAALNSSHRRK